MSNSITDLLLACSLLVLNKLRHNFARFSIAICQPDNIVWRFGYCLTLSWLVLIIDKIWAHGTITKYRAFFIPHIDQYGVAFPPFCAYACCRLNIIIPYDGVQ